MFRQPAYFSTSPQPDLAAPLPAAFQWLQSEFRLREEEGRGRKEISIKKQSLLNTREKWKFVRDLSCMKTRKAPKPCQAGISSSLRTLSVGKPGSQCAGRLPSTGNPRAAHQMNEKRRRVSFPALMQHVVHRASHFCLLIEEI